MARYMVTFKMYDGSKVRQFHSFKSMEEAEREIHYHSEVDYEDVKIEIAKPFWAE